MFTIKSCVLTIAFLQITVNYGVTARTIGEQRNEKDVYILGLTTKTKCYGELGCFSTGGDFKNRLVRPLQHLPSSREEIGVSFELFHRDSPTTGKPLKVHKRGLIDQSGLRPAKPIKFIVHSFGESRSKPWITAMRKDLLQKDDVNVIVVDWKPAHSYMQETANARLVGAEIALIINYIKQTKRVDLKDVHLVGFGIGAHISGYAGKYFHKHKIGKITGLDPIAFFFDGMKPAVRLVREDARYVEIIHTNARGAPKGFGSYQASGHVDYYLNGGKSQPGCWDEKVFSVLGNMKEFSCSHLRAVEFYKATILSKCPHKAFRCDSYEKFKSGACLSCASETDCMKVGPFSPINSTAISSGSKKFFIDTDSVGPYCGHHYSFRINFHGETAEYEGRFTIQFQIHGSKYLPILILPSKSTYHRIYSDGFLGGLQALPTHAKEFHSILISWIPKRGYLPWYKTPQIRISSIDVYDDMTKDTKRYCNNEHLKPEIGYQFYAC